MFKSYDETKRAALTNLYEYMQRVGSGRKPTAKERVQKRAWRQTVTPDRNVELAIFAECKEVEVNQLRQLFKYWVNGMALTKSVSRTIRMLYSST